MVDNALNQNSTNVEQYSRCDDRRCEPRPTSQCSRCNGQWREPRPRAVRDIRILVAMYISCCSKIHILIRQYTHRVAAIYTSKAPPNNRREPRPTSEYARCDGHRREPCPTSQYSRRAQYTYPGAAMYISCCGSMHILLRQYTNPSVFWEGGPWPDYATKPSEGYAL